MKYQSIVFAYLPICRIRVFSTDDALEQFIKDDPRIEYLNRLSSVSHLVYLIWCFDGEIHNGGFDQLFVNSLGNHTQEILEGLRLIDTQKSEVLLKEAMAYFPDTNPP